MKNKSNSFLPFSSPLIGEEEIEEVIDTMKTGWLTTGPKCKRFEEEFAQTVGVKHAISVNSATAGLHLTLRCYGIKGGDKVITSPFTFTATAESIAYVGADPVFVDIDPQTLNLDTNRIRDALAADSSIKAIMPVHYAGLACDMKAILEIADEYNVIVIEDAAHALPTMFKKRMVGSIGDATVFSFYANKTISTGEGGMITTNCDEIASKARILRLHGISRDAFNRYTSSKPAWHYDVVDLGYKYNMTDLAASIGIHQLKKVWQFQEQRQKIAEQYDQAFKGLPILTPAIGNDDDVHAWHLYVILLELDKINLGRNEFIEKMAELGVGTSVHFIPLHMQPYWKQKYGYSDNDYPVAASVYARAVSLPIYPKMTSEDVLKVIDSVKSVLA